MLPQASVSCLKEMKLSIMSPNITFLTVFHKLTLGSMSVYIPGEDPTLAVFCPMTRYEAL